MKFIIEAFNLILYQPLFNLLIFLYQKLPGNDFGIAIIFLTIFVRILLFPLTSRGVKSQKIFQDLQSKIEEIQKKYKGDREKQTIEIMKIYKEAKINPFSGILPLLIQLPILFAFYRVFTKGLNPEEMVNLYDFLPKPAAINPSLLGIINLSKPSLIFAIFAGLSQFWQTKMVSPKKEKINRFSNIFQKQTLYFFPILTIFILLKLPSALSLYWLISTILLIIQQYFVLKNVK